jgi:hypothetical protein
MKYKFGEKYCVLSNFDIYESFDKLIEIKKGDNIEKCIYDNASYGYYCISENGKINIYKSVEEVSIHTYILNENGLLIGVDNGEWGGKLIYKNLGLYFNINNDRIILEENIQFIFNLNDEIMVLSGLAHLMTNYGNLYVLEYNKDYDELVIMNKIELGSEPASYTIYNNKLYITTLRSVIIVNNGKIEYEFKYEDWFFLYPNSIYINNDEIIIGTDGCIMIINVKLNNYKLYIIKYRK